MTAAIRNNYSIVKLLFADGYRIFEKLADDRFFFTQGKFDFSCFFSLQMENVFSPKINKQVGLFVKDEKSNLVFKYILNEIFHSNQVFL